jgi:hypothetical protein
MISDKGMLPRYLEKEIDWEIYTQGEMIYVSVVPTSSTRFGSPENDLFS